jgi:DNA mismatch repair protein MutS
MQADRATLTDLGVFSDGREPDLIANIDRTCSRGGRQRLRELLQQPLSSVDEIRARQRALQGIASVPAATITRDRGELCDRVQAYLDSPYDELPANPVDRWIVARRYPEMTQKLVQWLAMTRSLLRTAADVSFALDDIAVGSDVLGDLIMRLRAWSDVATLARLAAVPAHGVGESSALAKLDRPVRRSARTALAGVLAALNELEALQSLAALSSRPGYSYPEMVDDDGVVFEARALHHPLLTNAVSNDVSLGSDGYGRLLFVTGPNMAGKTTALRTCGLAVLMAHVGAAVPALDLRLSTFDVLFANLSAHDSLARGESLFLAEVRRIGVLVGHLTARARVFGVVDEMLKGTNVHDAHDATRLVVTGLADYPRGLFVVASHLAELAESLAACDSIRFGQMTVLFDGGVARTTFRLEAGVSRQRLGMYILEQQGIVQALASIASSSSALR